MSVLGSSELLYPDCGCRPERDGVINVVCRNPDCVDYGTHRRALYDGDHCQWCGAPFTPLVDDLLRGAR